MRGLCHVFVTAIIHLVKVLILKQNDFFTNFSGPGTLTPDYTYAFENKFQKREKKKDQTAIALGRFMPAISPRPVKSLCLITAFTSSGETGLSERSKSLNRLPNS